MKVVGILESAKRLSVSRTTVYELVKEGKLPKPLRISANRTGFLDEDLDAYIEQCARARDPQPEAAV